MKLSEINPFLRYARLQPSVLSGASLRCSYDYRLFYILEGTACFVLSDRSIPICAGTLIYFRPDTPYCFDGKVKAIVLNFDMTRAHSIEKTPRAPSKDVGDFDRSLVFENDPPSELADVIVIENAFAIENLLQECLVHFSYPTAISDASTSAIVKQVLCYVVQRSTHPSLDFPKIVQKIIRYIRQNFDQDISNSQISKQFGYHPVYLNRIFKKSTGITIHQAVINERIRIAKNLLEETDLSIQSIAYELGYADHTRFCTTFKACVKSTPLEYRKGNR